MDKYAVDAAAVVQHLDRRGAIHIGHSTGGGEVAGDVERHHESQGRVAKAAPLSAVPPLTLKTQSNPAASDRGLRQVPQGAGG